MKKNISILLALVMVLALSVPAFAVEPTTGSRTQDVTATYIPAVEGGVPGTVYNVTITWTPNDVNDLTYSGGSQATYRWDASSLKYVIDDGTDTAAGWSGSTGYKVTVTNNSNADVEVTVDATALYELTATAEGAESATLYRADQSIANSGGNYWTNGDTGSATNMEVTYTYSDTGDAIAPEVTSSTSITVGTITVSLS